ncbi:MAG: dihydropteroate synthase [Sulfuricurvum sp. GWF2_44_89]|uniref:dihydropteroate synthase n=1 Tax=Sulfuricurvum kujiense TaxID=148813 RepID=A0A2D3WKB6_9BACT|nr:MULTISPECIES: dihydropteroate synthase [Sulfuricurvum]OHD78978.1 MAG: dihydropteroate synthase [Sulfuricurvum sp. GWF2_44_89]OHD93040.1 MAG: dihydropteroate synthase [Sulfuricurvum sp. RIFOXYD12_FULL_44_77]OHD97053.1 MAG: dihydropteroate synthase [Sulfuricurvum sp. RIFOXYD2_FULL_44_160]DAB38164.1 MAG TPA: dihydropteroate synthase [Sulfuricurvum kujiense]
MVVEKLSNTIDLHRELKSLGVDGGGISILEDKAQLHLIRIRDLHVGAANILKQDALSIGADLAVPRGTVTASIPRVDVVLIATERQLQALVKKEKAQPFGLKQLSIELESFCRLKRDDTVSVMGILNANDDSFYHASRFQGSHAIKRIETMIAEGADIIDIGGVSSRPGSVAVSADEELSRVAPIIDTLYEQRLYEKTKLSLDSYEPSVIHYALERGFHIINDITGLANDEVARLCGSYGATAVIMHMQGTPATMQENPSYSSVISEVEAFFRQRIEKGESFGIKDMILDCGIGFGKRTEENCLLIAHQSHFLRLGKKLMVGASRKSMINAISPSESDERLAGTLAIHLKAIEEGATIIRAHDVKEHVQAIKVWKALRT